MKKCKGFTPSKSQLSVMNSPSNPKNQGFNVKGRPGVKKTGFWFKFKVVTNAVAAA